MVDEIILQQPQLEAQIEHLEARMKSETDFTLK